MEVSIAMATYNGAEYLCAQLESLVAQSHRPLEIVIADDGSTDETLDIIKRFSTQSDIPIVVVPSNTKLGYRLNFRRAVKACSGALIAFCDQDDVWAHDKLANLVPHFSDDNTKLVYHNAIAFTDDFEWHLYNASQERSAIDSNNYLPFKSSNGLVQVFREELRKFDSLWDMSVDHHEGDTILAHDQWFFFLALLIGKVEFIDSPLLHYRQHQNNTYGVRLKKGILSQHLRRFVHFGDQDVWASSSAKSRAFIAREISFLEERSDILEVSYLYDRLSNALDNRSKVYSNTSVSSRALALITSLWNGDYGQWKWAFKKSSIVRDLWKGVLLRQEHDPSRS